MANGAELKLMRLGLKLMGQGLKLMSQGLKCFSLQCLDAMVISLNKQNFMYKVLAPSITYKFRMYACI